MGTLSRLAAATLVACALSGCGGDAPTAPLSSSTLLYMLQTSGDAGVYAVQSDGSGRRRLTPADVWPSSYAVSPDARRIAVSVAYSPTTPVWIFDAAGGVVQKLPAPQGGDVSAFGSTFLACSWSRGGQLLVGGQGGDLALMTTGGSFQAIAMDGMSFDGAFSPDGSRIAFTRSGAHGTEIASMNADGSTIQYLTDGSGGAGEAQWSPDGTRIAFAKQAGFVTNASQVQMAIYVMNADGTGVVKLSPDSVYDASPTWSPDGRQLAFLRAPDGNDLDVWIMNADGSGAHAITSDGGAKRRLRWSP